jgi:hypothetical protein
MMFLTGWTFNRSGQSLSTIFFSNPTESLLTAFFWPDATRDCLGEESVVERNIILGVKHEP